MEFFSAEFFPALLAIVVIDLVLAGDNAIVIALAARNLPVQLRQKAIIWGTVGAIVVRTAMTVVVVGLLKIPGLLLLGGVLLVWIAYKLLADQDDGGHKIGPAGDFWSAMKTIVVADAVMGLDNVLAVAGAAQGSFLLVVLGLLISIPIVIWGSQLILRFVERYPVIVYIGGAVLAWTAAKMIMSEPLIKAYFEQHEALSWISYAIVMGGVLGAGFLVNYSKVSARVAAHLVDGASITSEMELLEEVITQGEKAMEMHKVLIPVDGSSNALKAVQRVVSQVMKNQAMEVHLLHVRTPLSRHISRFVSKRNRAAFHRDEANKALRSARELLDRFGVPYAAHAELGDKAQVIAGVARRLHVDQIIMGTARKNSFTRMVEDSVTNKVLELATVPVEVIAGDSISNYERIGVPAGIGATLALLYIAAE